MFRYICIKIVKNIFGFFDSDGHRYKIKQNLDSPNSQMICEDCASNNNNESPHICNAGNKL